MRGCRAVKEAAISNLEHPVVSNRGLPQQRTLSLDMTSLTGHNDRLNGSSVKQLKQKQKQSARPLASPPSLSSPRTSVEAIRSLRQKKTQSSNNISSDSIQVLQQVIKSKSNLIERRF